jgi:lysine 2,3-aminomutase
MSTEWRRFAAWKNISPQEFEDSGWQGGNAVVRIARLERAVEEFVSPGMLRDIEAGVARSGMSVRLNPCIISLVDRRKAEPDRIRRQFIPMASELEHDHPCFGTDSLQEPRHPHAPNLDEHRTE